MTVPNYQTNMLPLIEFAGNQYDDLQQEAIGNLAGHFKFTEATLQDQEPRPVFLFRLVKIKVLPTPLLLYSIQISGKAGDDAKHYQIKAVKAVIEESRR